MRLRRVEDEFAGTVRIEHRSFLLRPRPDARRTLEQFRTYTQSWLRPAAEPDAGTFRVWEGDAGPPSHSIPPHLVAKAAASLGGDAFRRMDERLLHAYFAESRDITDRVVLRALWGDAALPADAFARADDPALLSETIAQHNQAVESGINGVPAVRVVGDDAFILGAQPVEVYQRWFRRRLGA